MFEKLRVLLGMTEASVTNDDEHNTVYQRGSKLIDRYMLVSDRRTTIDWWAKRQIASGIRDLDAVTSYNPQNWAAFWIKGKGYQVLRDPYLAYTEFHTCFAIQKDNADVARELALSCLDIGRAEEAAEVTEHAISLTPDDAGLYANLALAYLLCGLNEKARSAITKSLQINPDDSISQSVSKLIAQVIAGERTQPKSMADLQKS